MKKIDGFALRSIGKKKVIIGESLEHIDFNQIIELNESASYIWENLPNGDFTDTDVAHLLMEQYGIDQSTALTDVQDILHTWLESGILAE